MPCRTDDYPSTPDECKRERERQEDDFNHNSRLAEIFCATMQALENSGRKSLPKWIPSAANQWWRDHKARDKSRLDAEMAVLKVKKDREAALEKLTPYERKLLGIS